MPDGVLLDFADSALFEGRTLPADGGNSSCFEGAGLEKEGLQKESVPPQVELPNPLDELFVFEIGGVESELVSDTIGFLCSSFGFWGCFDCSCSEDDCEWRGDGCVGVACAEGGVDDIWDVVERSN